MSKSVLLSYIIIADVTRIKSKNRRKKTHKNTILSGANSQATELSSATGRDSNHNLGLPQVSSPTLYPLGHDCSTSFSYIYSLSFLHTENFRQPPHTENILKPPRHILSISILQYDRHNLQLTLVQRLKALGGWGGVLLSLY